MSRQGVLGALLGLSAGLLMASCLLVVAYILVLFLFPVLLAPLALGIVLGVRLARAGVLPRLPSTAIVAVGAVSLPAAVLLPYMNAVAELHILGRDIPVPPEAVSLSMRTNPFGSASAGPSAARLFETARAPGDVVSYYRQVLRPAGWKEVSASAERAWFTREGSHLFVETRLQDGQTAVAARRHVDLVWSPGLMLLGAGAVTSVLLWRYRRAASV